ncbi:hypothetical protein PITC_091940 [Penicillium italicum]|uniref:Uncharacterized protein n=1 Tax=Penicillium italicum TaxID=40296 RepID=A0A0A2L8B6_PENIT|nr:hypothetical protein PITC_091940 [Penicillium italicum]
MASLTEFLFHNPLSTRSKCLSIRCTPHLNSFSTPSFAEPKLSELVPTLTVESNFASSSTALKCALDTRNPHIFHSISQLSTLQLQLPPPPASPLQPMLLLSATL